MNDLRQIAALHARFFLPENLHSHYNRLVHHRSSDRYLHLQNQPMRLRNLHIGVQPVNPSDLEPHSNQKLQPYLIFGHQHWLRSMHPFLHGFRMYLPPAGSEYRKDVLQYHTVRPGFAKRYTFVVKVW
ncbi:hypothetical protein D3C85_1459250 [compost metagenome]